MSHIVLDEGRLVVAHAGLKEAYQGRSSGRVRDFALFGDTTGETDELGLPVRRQWAADYRGEATVVYGHTPVAEPEWLNNTVNIDTGCVFGGTLTALRWPERELVSVPARRTWYEPAKPFLPAGEEAGAEERRPAFLLDVEDVAGKRIVQTRLARTVTVREENATGALEVMSRFAIDPRWLVHLPPTMAPTATSRRPDLLEHPEDAFAEYRSAGVPEVICEEKHMGSRALALVCRDAGVARDRFGVGTGETGAVYTRTGRPFLDAATDTEAVLDRVRASVGAAGLWDELGTGWLLLDCELLPWSAKALDLVRRQYAAVGAGARAGLGATVAVLERAAARGLAVDDLLAHERARTGHVERYTEAYRRYVRPVAGVADLRLAPFHVLAAETGVFADRDHAWHLERCDRLVVADPSWFQPTARRVVDVTDATSQQEAGRLVGGDDGRGRGGDGGQADVVRGPRAQGNRPAGSEVPRARVPADHLRPGVRRPVAARAPARTGSGPQALAGRPRVRARSRGPRALRPGRAAAPRPRVRVRRARPGERAGRPAALVGSSPGCSAKARAN